MHQFDLFDEWKELNRVEKKWSTEVNDKVKQIIEWECPQCKTPWFSGLCQMCLYREKDDELEEINTLGDIEIHHCTKCKIDSFSEVCHLCWKNLKHWEKISEAKKWIWKIIDKWIINGIKISYYNFPSRIGEKNASFDFILEKQEKTRWQKRKKIRIDISYESDIKNYRDIEWAHSLEVFKIKILRREIFKNRKWEKINFLEDFEYRAIITLMKEILKEKNKT